MLRCPRAPAPPRQPGHSCPPRTAGGMGREKQSSSWGELNWFCWWAELKLGGVEKPRELQEAPKMAPREPTLARRRTQPYAAVASTALRARPFSASADWGLMVWLRQFLTLRPLR
eukprot:4789753-Pyramimonas_sp.AAC.1